VTWRGRKRKNGRRERNGRVKRQPAVAREDVMGVALRQPHRRNAVNPRDSLLESALGRFVIKHDLDFISYGAALDFARLTRKVFASLGVPQPVGDGRQATGRAFDDEIVQRLRCELDEIETRLRSVGRAGFDALRQLALFERETLPEQAKEAALVLCELANEKTA
jgi:hypothetical protein